MKRTLAIAVAVAAVITLLALNAALRGPTAARLAAPAEIPTGEPVEVVSAPARFAPAEVRALVSGQPEAPAPAPTEAQVASDDVVLFGRCIDADELPVAGVGLRWREAVTGPDGKVRYPWSTSRSDTTGRFELRTPRPNSGMLFLELGGDGYGRQELGRRDLEPGARVDLGDVTVTVGATVLGRVLEEDGSVAAAGWSIILVQRAGGSARFDVRPHDDSGSFRIEDVPPGRYDLIVFFKGRGKTVVTLQARAGEQIELEPRFVPPSTEGLVRALFHCDPYGRVALAPEHVSLVAPDGTRLHPQESSASLELRNLAPGKYALEIDDPRFEPWRRDGIEPGAERLRVELAGDCTLALSVVDAMTGAPVESYSATLKVATYPAPMVELRAADEPSPPGGVFEGVPTRGGRLTITAPGYAELRHRLASLTLHEHRVLSLSLTPVTVVSGRVVDEHGAAPGYAVPVGLFAPAELDDGPASPLWRALSHSWPEPDAGEASRRVELYAGKSEPDGSFRFEVAAGTWIPAAHAGPGLVAVGRPVTAGVDGASSGIVLRIPTAATISGRLLAPEGTPLEQLQVTVGLGRELPPARVDAEGRFALGPVAPGRVELTLLWPDAEAAGRNPFDGGLQLGFAPRRTLATVAVEAGVNVWEHELGEALPGSITVRVHSGGEPLAGATVHLWNEGGSTLDSGSLSAMSDGNGRVRFELVPPGTWWADVYFQGSHVSRVADPNAIRVTPGEALELWRDVSTVKATLRVVDAESGDALADQKLWLITYTSSGGISSRVHTDASGSVELELSPGSYGLSRVSSFRNEAARVALEWTAGGPAAEVLALPAAPSASDG